MSGYSVGVDFGTSTTAAVLRWPDGSVRPLVIDGSELMPSAVCRDPSGALLAGRDALHAGRSFPAGLEPNPKRCVDDGTVLLGGVEVPVLDLFAAVLRRVADEARRAAGGPLLRTTVTCPVGWGPARRRILLAAAAAAGLAPVVAAHEPVAAAVGFLRTGDLAVGAHLLVYDLGAGTFDASLVRRTPAGFEVMAQRGLPDAGGMDIDAAIVGHLGIAYGAREPERWTRLVRPVTEPDRRAAHQFREDVRTAKEMLSRSATTTVAVPLFDDTAPLGREELDRLAGPVLERTVAAARAVLADARIDRPDAVFLVGGASRTPLAATLLHRALGVAPTVFDRPELVVAEGSIDTDPLPSPAPPRVSLVKRATPVDIATPDNAALDNTAPERGDNDRRAVLAAAAATLLLGASVAWRFLRDSDDKSGRATPRTSPSTNSSPSDTLTAAGEPLVAGATLTGHTGQIQAMAFSADGRILASSGEDRTIRIWNPQTGAAIRTMGGSGDNYGMSELAISPDGGRVAVAHVGPAGRDIQLWNVGSGRVTLTLRNIGHTPTAMQFTPDGGTLLSSHLDGRVRIWNLSNGGLVHTLPSNHEVTWQVWLSRDGRRAVTGNSTFTDADPDPGSVQVWDMASRSMTNRFDGYGDGSISPNGGLLALTSMTGTLHRCDPTTGAITQLAGDQIGYATVFVTDTLLLRTLLADRGDPQLWDLSTGQAVGELPGRRLAVRPDGGMIAAVGADNTIRLWTVAA